MESRATCTSSEKAEPETHCPISREWLDKTTLWSQEGMLCFFYSNCEKNMGRVWVIMLNGGKTNYKMAYELI